MNAEWGFGGKFDRCALFPRLCQPEALVGPRFVWPNIPCLCHFCLVFSFVTVISIFRVSESEHDYGMEALKVSR